MQLDTLQISASASLQEALQQIERNHEGVIFITESSGSVVGVATDGDVRRHLLAGGSLNDKVSECATKDFVWESPQTPREGLLKKLDDHITIIPILDAAGRLVDLASRRHLPIESQRPVYARARAPVRLSFSGGGSDLTHYFSKNDYGAAISATISIYSHATLRIRNDQRVIVRSSDIGETLQAENLTSALREPGRFGLIQSLLKAIRPDFGFELFLHSEFPVRSGLGGSAVVSAAILGCFNQIRRDQWDLHELAEIAYQAERHYLGVLGGWQDQYATVFGGFNFMEFRMDQNIVHPLRIHYDILLELEECLVLCDTGTTHNSGDIHQDQRTQLANEQVREIMETNVKLSYEMRNHLLRGRLMEFGQSLGKAWTLKRMFSHKISSENLDKIYADAMAHGATGGKLLGAGGGGFFLFYAPPFRKHDLAEHLEGAGLKIRPFRFEPQGLQAWTVRESRNHRESEVL